MATAKKTKYLKGKRVRLTRVSAAGLPVYGDDSTAVSSGFVTASYTANIEEGEAISNTNANGEVCVSEPAIPSFTGYGIEIEFCEVDPALLALATGQEVYMDADGDIVGLTESTDVDLTAVNFALEMWTGAQADVAASDGSQGRFGYIVTPFVGGGVISDLTVENGAITFTVGNASTKNGTGWGEGPYDVQLGADGLPGPMLTPMGVNDHRRWFYTEVAPPEPTDGTVPLENPDTGA